MISCSPGWPWNHDLHVSVSQVREWQMYAPMIGFICYNLRTLFISVIIRSLSTYTVIGDRVSRMKVSKKTTPEPVPLRLMGTRLSFGVGPHGQPVGQGWDPRICASDRILGATHAQ